MSNPAYPSLPSRQETKEGHALFAAALQQQHTAEAEAARAELTKSSAEWSERWEALDAQLGETQEAFKAERAVRCAAEQAGVQRGKSSRWVTLRSRWVTLRSRWVTLTARWVTLRSRWVTLTARWVAFTGLELAAAREQLVAHLSEWEEVCEASSWIHMCRQCLPCELDARA